MKVICESCGKKYNLNKCYYKRSKHHFCSKKCSGDYKNTKVEVNCRVCGKKYLKRKSEIKKNNFCSKECLNKWQSRNKIELICKTCGKKFYRSKSWLNQKQGYYCSIDCRNKDDNWKQKACYNSNFIQCKRKGLNKLEIKGNKILDNLNMKYETQYLINNKICVDIYIKDYNLIIQWDGNYWHGKNIEYDKLDIRQKKRRDLDISQDKYLKKCGYNILRFWEDEVFEREEYVSENIKRTIYEIAKRV